MKAHPEASQKRACISQSGFTRMELAAVLAVLSGLLLVSAPAVNNSRSEAQTIECLDNHRQMIKAWQSHGVDNDDVLAGGVSIPLAQTPSAYRGSGLDPWGTGVMSWDSGIGNTNALYLIDPTFAALASFIGPRKDIFRCPVDSYVSSIQKARNWQYRVRSVSMNSAVGNGSGGDFLQAPYVSAKKLSEMLSPPPASVYVFIEEHPDSINDTMFFSPSGSSSALNWVDFPGTFHDGAANLSFADGHVELHRWLAASIRNLRVTTAGLTPPTPSSQLPDAKYLYDRTPKQLGR